MIWFTSDWHFGHDRQFIWGPRGFSSINDHDVALIETHNHYVAPEDDVYVLGDLMLGDNEHGINCIKLMNGKLHIIRGNHDTDRRIELYSQLPQVVEICDAKYIKAKGYHFFLCHYPCITSNYGESNKPIAQRTLNICGHVHTKNPLLEMEQGHLSYHVEIDAQNGYPITVESVIQNFINFFGHK